MQPRVVFITALKSGIACGILKRETQFLETIHTISKQGGLHLIIVGICGASGSGKSTLAKRIADSLACTCTIIGQDCYYRSFPELPLEKRVKLNYDEPEIFDFDEMYADVCKLQRGEPITTKGYDYVEYLRADKPDVLIQPPEVLILEGIHMFYDKRLCDLMALKVYLHVDVDVCLLRRIKRDIKVRGRAIDNIAEQYMETVKPANEKYIANYINDADFAVMRGGKNKMAIDAISAYLTTKVLAERFEREAGKAAVDVPPAEPEADALPGDQPAPQAASAETSSRAAETRAAVRAVKADETMDDLDDYAEEMECEQEDDDASGYYRRRSRQRRRLSTDVLRFLLLSIVLNAGVALFGLFLFGQVYNHDWAMTKSGGFSAMIDAVAQVFFLVLPIILAVLFNRLLYKICDLEYSPGWLVLLLVLWVLIVLGGTVYLVYAGNMLGGMASFGLGSLLGA